MKTIDYDDPEYVDIVDRINECIKKTQGVLPAIRTPLGNETFYTGSDLCDKLKMSKRTLQDYRDRTIIPYTSIGGKILYRQSDLLSLFDANFQPAIEGGEY